MPLLKFHSPYHPNDGHGPGVPLPEQVYAYLLSIDGQVLDLYDVMKEISLRFPGAHVAMHGDYLGIEQGHGNDPKPWYRWWGIGYREPNSLPTLRERPDGLHQRYAVRKLYGDNDPRAQYFVLRLDEHGDDKVWLECCRDAALHLCDKLDARGHLPLVAHDLRKFLESINERMEAQRHV